MASRQLFKEIFEDSDFEDFTVFVNGHPEAVRTSLPLKDWKYQDDIVLTIRCVELHNWYEQIAEYKEYQFRRDDWQWAEDRDGMLDIQTVDGENVTLSFYTKYDV